MLELCLRYQSLQEQHEALNLMKINGSHASDWMKGMEKELTELKQESSHAAAQLRTVKASTKDAADGLNAHKAHTRRALDELEKRSEAYSRACTIFADLLKVSNPVKEQVLGGSQSL